MKFKVKEIGLKREIPIRGIQLAVAQQYNLRNAKTEQKSSYTLIYRHQDSSQTTRLQLDSIYALPYFNYQQIQHTKWLCLDYLS